MSTLSCSGLEDRVVVPRWTYCVDSKSTTDECSPVLLPVVPLRSLHSEPFSSISVLSLSRPSGHVHGLSVWFYLHTSSMC